MLGFGLFWCLFIGVFHVSGAVRAVADVAVFVGVLGRWAGHGIRGD
jgi:hypothetical protein